MIGLGRHRVRFRAPTLNELYRQFRVGTVLTLANPPLGPERLVGGELGVSVMPARNLTWRTTWFDNRVKDPVVERHASTPPAPTSPSSDRIWAERGSGASRPTSSTASARCWRLSGGVSLRSGQGEGERRRIRLVGKFLAQVPAHRGSVQVAVRRPADRVTLPSTCRPSARSSTTTRTPGPCLATPSRDYRNTGSCR